MSARLASEGSSEAETVPSARGRRRSRWDSVRWTADFGDGEAGLRARSLVSIEESQMWGEATSECEAVSNLNTDKEFNADSVHTVCVHSPVRILSSVHVSCGAIFRYFGGELCH